MEDQLTSLTLEKDALSDQVSHVRAEMEFLKSQLERAYQENNALSRCQAELEVKQQVLSTELLEKVAKMTADELQREEREALIEELHNDLGKPYVFVNFSNFCLSLIIIIQQMKPKEKRRSSKSPIKRWKVVTTVSRAN